MKRKIRSLIAFLLCLVLVFSSSPMKNLAYAMAAEDTTAAEAGEESTFSDEEEEESVEASSGENVSEDTDIEGDAASSNNNEEEEAAIDPEGDASYDNQKKEESAEQTFRKTEYVYEDTAVKVTAVLSDVKAIPDDAKLAVIPVNSGSEDYDYAAYMKALNKADKDADYNKQDC